MEYYGNGSMAKWFVCCIINPGVLGLYPLTLCMVDLAFHFCKVDQVSFIG